MSDEGDIYYDEPDELRSDKIPGAGLYSDDAQGLGAMNEIINLDGVLFAVGLGQQLYKFDNSKWEKIENDIFKAKGDVEGFDFYGINGTSPETFYVTAKEDMKSGEAPEELEDELWQASIDDDFENFQRLSREIEKYNSRPAKGRTFHCDGSNWSEVDVEDQFPEAVFVDSSNQVWLGGAGNCTLMKVDEDGEIDPTEIDDEERGSIYSITEFQNRLILANDYGLYAYNEDYDSLDDEVVRIKPKLVKKLGKKPSPLKVQTIDDVMFYFDYNLGIYIWDGDKNWTNIPIPDVLLEREFKGL